MAYVEEMLTERLEVRRPVEADRQRFVDLFTDDEFMVFADGTLDEISAHARFDLMLLRADEMLYAKQPVVVRSTGEIIGYVGVNRFEFEGASELEFGWRLIAAARGKGHGTEAAEAVIALIESSSFVGTVFAMIDPTNMPSQRVAKKLGFEYWKLAEVGGFIDQIHRRHFL